MALRTPPRFGVWAGAPVTASVPSRPAASASDSSERRVMDRTSLRGECTPSADAPCPVRLGRQAAEQDGHRDQQDGRAAERRVGAEQVGHGAEQRAGRRRSRGPTASGRRSWPRRSCPAGATSAAYAAGAAPLTPEAMLHTTQRGEEPAVRRRDQEHGQRDARHERGRHDHDLAAVAVHQHARRDTRTPDRPGSPAPGRRRCGPSSAPADRAPGRGSC